MKTIYCLLFLLLFANLSAIDFKSRVLSESELKRNSSQYILVDENNLEKLFQKESKIEKSKILSQKAHFHLQKQGLELNLELETLFKESPLKLLSKDWIILHSNVFLNSNASGFFLNKKNSSKIIIKAILPIFEKSNHWQFSLPWNPTLSGKVKFTKGKEFLNMQIQLFASTLLRSFPAQDQLKPFSNVQKIKISASLPLNAHIKKPKAPVKVVVKKSRKALVFAESTHQFNVSRKYLHYTFNSQVKISRNPIKELKIHIPKDFKLKNIQIKPHSS
ncbi:hypothetical protein MJH12_16315, partial [bacterium]|nr:hypothetical protein [bacterium]